MLSDNCYVVVMAGGTGTRLWPLSSKNKPKHLLKLFDGKCLIELTIEKLKDHIPNDRIIILTSVNRACSYHPKTKVRSCNNDCANRRPDY